MSAPTREHVESLVQTLRDGCPKVWAVSFLHVTFNDTKPSPTWLRKLRAHPLAKQVIMSAVMAKRGGDGPVTIGEIEADDGALNVLKRTVIVEEDENCAHEHWSDVIETFKIPPDQTLLKGELAVDGKGGMRIVINVESFQLPDF